MNSFDKITNALQIAHPTSTWGNATNGETYASFVWVDNAITEDEYNAAIAAYDAKAYSRSRANEYPSIADQLDDIYHNGIDAWKATIKTTKDKYPKE